MSSGHEQPAAQTLDEMREALRRGARVRFRTSKIVHQPFGSSPGSAHVRTNCSLNGWLGENLEVTDEPTTCKRCHR